MGKKISNLTVFFVFGLTIFIICPVFVYATDFTSTNFKVLAPVIDAGQGRASSTSFGIGQSVWQTAAGKSSSTSFQIWSGFQYYFSASPNVLTATAGNGQVSLSWGVPQTFLGAGVANYELGVGTVSGSYVYTSVGNVTSYTKTGLNNGTTYYFKVKAETAGGTVLTFSNEASATPTGSTPTQSPGGGGGGGGYSQAAVEFSGLTSPFSQVVVLRSSMQLASVKSNNQGAFAVSLTNEPSGPQIYSLYAVDPANVPSQFLNIQVNVPSSGLAATDNLLLPPTIASDKTEVKKGDSIEFFGYTLPNSSVNLETSGQASDQFSATSGADGFYKYDLATKQAPLGTYSARSRAQYLSSVTPYSSSLNFLVGSKNVQTPQIGQCQLRADFNHDCKVDLVDFSILAFWYGKKNPDPKVDLNNDGVVDLIDFSILAYYWTG